MRCVVLFYSFCLYLRFIELLSTSQPKELRIIGGKDAKEDQYPYIVRLQLQFIQREENFQKLINEKHYCTASVLTPTWTLAAAHCFNVDDYLSELPSNVFLNFVIKYDSWYNLKTSTVRQTFKHPAYALRMYDIINDISLIRHDPIILKEYARLSGLDYITMIGQQVTLCGYGITNKFLKFSPSIIVEIAADATLLQRPLQLVDSLVVPCDKISGLPIRLGMCLASRCGTLPTLCEGDSGGPVLHPSGVVGVNSIASDENQDLCELEKISGVYPPVAATPVSPYIDWISSTIKNETQNGI